MTAHVFIVDDQTFPVHLQYRFAGTGARSHQYIDFNDSPNTKFHHSTENLLAGMIADVSRIRKGDRILFYLQNSKGREGRFYGIFRAAEDAAFLDNGGDKQFLLEELEKSLTFRILFEPEEVYPEGVTEWKALDEIRFLEKPCQMLWSLIYRKLKGNRGCTMITSYEEDRLCGLIRAGQRPLNLSNNRMNFDCGTRKIILSESGVKSYSGIKRPFLLMPRILEKYRKGNQFEAHLQAHVVGQIGRPGSGLTNILLENNRPIWLGNEVGCGVGMQSIDVMIAYQNRCRHIMPIELKTTQAGSDNVRQIKRYVDWIEQYYISNCPAVIEPVLITQKTGGGLSADFVQAVRQFNSGAEEKTYSNLRLVEFYIKNDEIVWENRRII
ncbi:MAG: DUF91 domain-containing protein [Gammaproteobacteria bacterium]